MLPTREQNEIPTDSDDEWLEFQAVLSAVGIAVFNVDVHDVQFGAPLRLAAEEKTG